MASFSLASQPSNKGNTMPTYTMKNVQTGEVRDMILSFRERDELLQTNQYEQLLSIPNFVTSLGGTLSKTSSDWRNLMTKIKKEAGSNNTVKD